MSDFFHINKEERYAEQRDLILETVFKHITIQDNDKILDVGAGLGEFLESITNPTVKKTGIDIDPECIEIAREHVPDAEFRVADAEDLPFPDESFDLVTAICVLEHVENVTALIRESYRVCKKGGRGVYVTPNIARPQRLWYAIRKREKWERSGHRAGFDYHLLKHVLEYNGWVVDKIATRFVDCPFYYTLPRFMGNYLSHRLLPKLFPRIGSELYAFCHKE